MWPRETQSPAGTETQGTRDCLLSVFEGNFCSLEWGIKLLFFLSLPWSGERRVFLLISLVLFQITIIHLSPPCSRVGQLPLAKQESEVYHEAQKEEKGKKYFLSRKKQASNKTSSKEQSESRKHMEIESCSSSCAGQQTEIFSRKISVPTVWKLRQNTLDIFDWLITCDSIPVSFKSN